jgi:hypothetical protein
MVSNAIFLQVCQRSSHVRPCTVRMHFVSPSGKSSGSYLQFKVDQDPNYFESVRRNGATLKIIISPIVQNYCTVAFVFVLIDVLKFIKFRCTHLSLEENYSIGAKVTT